MRGAPRIGVARDGEPACGRDLDLVGQAQRRHDGVDQVVAALVQLAMNTQVQVDLSGRGNADDARGIGRARGEHAPYSRSPAGSKSKIFSPELLSNSSTVPVRTSTYW